MFKFGNVDHICYLPSSQQPITPIMGVDVSNNYPKIPTIVLFPSTGLGASPAAEMAVLGL